MVNGKNFKLTLHETSGKTPLSEYKVWETSQGDFDIGGIYYDRTKKGILCQVVESIIKDRKIFKQKMFIADAIANNRSLDDYNKDLVAEVIEEDETYDYYFSQQYVRKILANSMFGCVCNEYFHLYNYFNGVSITLGGQYLIKYMKDSFNKYMKLYFHDAVHKLYPDFKGNFKPLQKDIVIQCDTDSLFLCLEEIVNNLGIHFKNNQEIYNWMVDIQHRFFDKVIDKLLKNYAKEFDFEQIMNFKREKIITQKIITARKKYVDEVLSNEDELYIDDPKIKVTGIEIIRTDTPIFCKKVLKQTVSKLFECKCKDKQSIIDYMKDVKNIFINSDISDIAIPKGVSDYVKYAKPIDEYINFGLKYPPSCPIHVRASINYNYVIKKLNLSYIPINNGTKIKYIHLCRSNIINQDVIAFIGNWPNEFNDIFKIDYDRQFQRTYISVIQRFFDTLKWGEIKLENNILSNFIEF